MVKALVSGTAVSWAIAVFVGIAKSPLAPFAYGYAFGWLAVTLLVFLMRPSRAG